MKKNGLLLFFAFLLTNQLFAQNWNTDLFKYGELYEGYVITAAGERIEGFIRYDDRYSMQNDIVFFKDKADKKNKVKYQSQDLLEYKVADKLYHCIHYSGGLLAKPVRGNLVVREGCITEYVWYNRADNYAVMTRGASESEEAFYTRMYPPVTVYKRKDQEDVRSLDYFALKFASKMAEFISDNAEIAAKVTAKEKGYGILNILDIIDEYNAKCTK